MIKELNKNYLNDLIEMIRIRAETSEYKNSGVNFEKEAVKNYILDTFKKGKIVGYFVNDRLIACGGIAFTKDGTGEIRHMFVFPEFQRQGIGSTIIKKLEEYAKGKVKKLKLDVLISNSAIKFYEANGYKKRAYVMVKKLE